MELLEIIFVKIPKKLYYISTRVWEYVYYRFFYSKPVLEKHFFQKRFLNGWSGNAEDLNRLFREYFSDKVQTKIEEADLICDHVFDLLGSGPRQLSPEGEGYQQIDWHCDFKSGYRWNPRTLHHHIRYGHIRGVDIKVPWELSRFQHLNILGQAHILTRDRKYAEEFVNQIKDWIKNNPVGFGINWNCTMEVAIRAANWLVAQEYFSEERLIPYNFWHEFYTSIYEHGKFIKGHLENHAGFTNNHYLSDLVGLFFIAIYCPFLKESKEWKEFTLRELSKEIGKQVYPDGCNFEASTSYHRLALELFFYAELLGKRAGIEFPERYKKQVRKMFEFSLYCIKPNGMIPQIGDNDNSRLFIFSKRPILEHKYLLGFAAIYYKEPEFKISSFDFDEESFWVFGKKSKEFYHNLPFRKELITSKAFPKAGWYIIRSGNDYCFISCGPNGQNGNGGHAHNDKLSFELMINGQDMVVDPGSYLYTSSPEERNKFRSTGYHNTIKFDDYEQNEIPKKDMFSLPDKIKIKEAGLKERDNIIFFQAEVKYPGIAHKRRLTFNTRSKNWQVQDSFSCSKPLNGKLIFHLPPNLTSDVNSILVKETRDKITSIEVKGYNLEKEKYNYSSEYGAKVKAECLVTNISATKDAKTLNTYIYKA